MERKGLLFILGLVVLFGMLYPQSIRVTSPKSGYMWTLGSKQPIEWEATGITNRFKIILKKGNATIGTIADNIRNNVRSYSWTVSQYIGGTAPLGTGYVIKVREISGVVDDSGSFWLCNNEM